jgi:hypothetical protein
MNERLQQLRGLQARLERLPPPTDRDWMLCEVRARVVDVESGIAPAAVRDLPVDDADEAIAAPAPPRLRNTPPPCHRPARVRAAHWPSPLPAVRQRSGSAGVVDLLQPGLRLCLDDPPASASARSWASGLRG